VRQLLRVEESGAFVGLVSGGVVGDDGNEDPDPLYDDDDQDDDDDDDDDDDEGVFRTPGRRRSSASSPALLDRRQQRVVKDLVAGVTRWQRRLDFVLSQLLAPPVSSYARGPRRRPDDGGDNAAAAGGNVSALDPPMRAVLRLALFELTERRLPLHALGGYVDLARHMSGARRGGDPERAAAFCNGVLRSAARGWERGDLPVPERALERELAVARQEGAAAAATSASARREAVRALAAVHSHPAWMVGRWVREWGAPRAEALLRRNNERPHHCLRASRPGGAPELLAALEREARDFFAAEEEEEEEEEEEQEDAGGGDARRRRSAQAPTKPPPRSAALAAAAALSSAAAAAASRPPPAAKAPPPPAAQPPARPPTTTPSSPAAPPRAPAPPPPSAAAALSPFLPDDFVRLPAEGGLLQAALRSGLVSSGLCTVQDEATGLVVRLALAPKPGESILDACAAPGGKALYASALLDGRGGAVVAADASAPRLRALEGTARRLAGAGPGGARATAALVVGPACDLRDYAAARAAWGTTQQRGREPPLPESYDAVLLDAPCSGTGVLAKRADLRWRRSQSQVERELPALQDALLDAAAALVKPGGRLVYATCSVERDENDARVDAFLRRPAGRDFEVEALTVGVGEGYDEATMTLWRSALDGPYLRLLPHVHGTDGAFAARLRRRA
jgi:16S rRNA C967 or C1407 C5-methylase (RsmB/RsmF family)